MSSRLAEQIDLEARSSFLKLRKIRAPLIAICLIAFFGVLIYLMIDTISDNQSQLDFKPISGYSAGLLFITIIFFRTVKKHLSLFSKKIILTVMRQPTELDIILNQNTTIKEWILENQLPERRSLSRNQYRSLRLI